MRMVCLLLIVAALTLLQLRSDKGFLFLPRETQMRQRILAEEQSIAARPPSHHVEERNAQTKAIPLQRNSERLQKLPLQQVSSAEAKKMQRASQKAEKRAKKQRGHFGGDEDGAIDAAAASILTSKFSVFNHTTNGTEEHTFVPQLFKDYVSVSLEDKIVNITCNAVPDYRPRIEFKYPAHHIHIPKCSGTSLARIIKNKLASLAGLRGCVLFKQRNSPMPDWHHLKPPNNTVRLALAQCDFISTHTPYGFPELWGATVNTQITILREPLSHLISNYDYILEYPAYFGVVGKYLKKVGISQYIINSAQVPVEKREVWWYDRMLNPNLPPVAVANRQTWFICGADCSIERMTLKQALNRAVENLLTKIHIVGVVEAEDALYQQLHAAYAFLPRTPRHDQAHRGRRTALTGEDRARLAGLLQADVLLHRIAGFVARCSSSG